MRRAFPILLLLVLPAAATVLAEPRRDPMSLDPDSVVATVNDDIILAREVQKLIGSAPGVPLAERLQLFEGQVANLVQHYLLKREAERFGTHLGRVAAQSDGNFTGHLVDRLLGTGAPLGSVGIRGRGLGPIAGSGASGALVFF